MTEVNRRDFLIASTAVAAAPLGACVARPLVRRSPVGEGGMPVRAPTASLIPVRETGTLVNDVHSQFNATRVDRIVKPRAVEELQQAIAAARSAATASSASSRACS
jgi:hypothetical protein